MIVNRSLFYNRVRNSLFGGKLLKSQVEGMDAIFDEWASSGLTDIRWLAYILATAFHETAATMQPIAEYGKGKGRPYGKPHPKTGLVYYGRGHVQLTWYENYVKMGKLLGLPLAHNPDLALQMEVSVKIMFEGMTTGKSFKGDFTGKHLGNYFNKTNEDWFNARRIINGTDKASKIGGYGMMFFEALK